MRVTWGTARARSIAYRGTVMTDAAEGDLAGLGAYERGRVDETFLDRFTAAYRGEHAPLDALWWLEHPGETAPSGALAPEAALEPLHRAVFGRDGASRPDVESELERVLDRIREQRELASSALVAADTVVALDTEGDRQHASEAGLGTDAPGVKPSRRRRVVTSAIVLVLAAAVGFTAGLFVRAAKTEDASAPTAVDISGVLAVLDRPQAPASDLPTHLDSSLIRPDTLRSIGMAGPAGLYAARDFDGEVCLLLVQPTGGYTSTCVVESEFPATGLPLRGTYLLPGTAGASEAGTNAEIDVLWMPDGTLTGTSTTPATPHDFGDGGAPLPAVLFEVFDRPQEERDRIPADTAGAPMGALDHDTERYLATDDGHDLFAARLVGAGGDLCLVLVDQGEAISACGPPPVSLSVERSPEYALSPETPGAGWDPLADGLWVQR